MLNLYAKHSTFLLTDFSSRNTSEEGRVSLDKRWTCTLLFHASVRVLTGRAGTRTRSTRIRARNLRCVAARALALAICVGFSGTRAYASRMRADTRETRILRAVPRVCASGMWVDTRALATVVLARIQGLLRCTIQRPIYCLNTVKNASCPELLQIIFTCVQQ